MRKMACLVLIAFSSRPSPAFAQIDFSTLKVKLGQTVDVTTGGTTRVAPPQFANTSWIELKQAEAPALRFTASVLLPETRYRRYARRWKTRASMFDDSLKEPSNAFRGGRQRER